MRKSLLKEDTVNTNFKNDGIVLNCLSRNNLLANDSLISCCTMDMFYMIHRLFTIEQ